MPVYTTTEITPKKKSLVVCAGTITTPTVSSMGSGFDVFHRLFTNSPSFSNDKKPWQDELQIYLDDYFKNEKSMPFYISVAKNAHYTGGVATVPHRKDKKGLIKKETLISDEEARLQYQSAIRESMVAAGNLKLSLYIQPLGIGVYGWDPKEAAKLFAETILQTDPKDIIDITIPIYQPETFPNNKIFLDTFTQEMANRGRPTNTPIQPKPQSELPKNSVLGDQDVLVSIVQTLINNIENKENGRFSSGLHSKKVHLLEVLNTSLKTKGPMDHNSEEYKGYLEAIMEICIIKRNLFHFWKTPNSVKEFLELLASNKINFDFTQTNNISNN